MLMFFRVTVKHDYNRQTVLDCNITIATSFATFRRKLKIFICFVCLATVSTSSDLSDNVPFWFVVFAFNYWFSVCHKTIILRSSLNA